MAADDDDSLATDQVLAARLRGAPVIIATAVGNLPTAVRAVEAGAFDYLAKPFDLQQALDAVNRAVVVDLIDEKKRAGVAMVAIVHDDEIRNLIADRVIDVTSFAAAA